MNSINGVTLARLPLSPAHDGGMSAKVSCSSTPGCSQPPEMRACCSTLRKAVSLPARAQDCPQPAAATAGQASRAEVRTENH